MSDWALSQRSGRKAVRCKLCGAEFRLGYGCCPSEHLMLVNSSGCVVLFLRNISELNRTEKDMGLERTECL